MNEPPCTYIHITICTLHSPMRDFKHTQCHRALLTDKQTLRSVLGLRTVRPVLEYRQPYREYSGYSGLLEYRLDRHGHEQAYREESREPVHSGNESGGRIGTAKPCFCFVILRKKIDIQPENGIKRRDASPARPVSGVRRTLPWILVLRTVLRKQY